MASGAIAGVAAQLLFFLAADLKSAQSAKQLLGNPLVCLFLVISITISEARRQNQFWILLRPSLNNYRFHSRATVRIGSAAELLRLNDRGLLPGPASIRLIPSMSKESSRLPRLRRLQPRHVDGKRRDAAGPEAPCPRANAGCCAGPATGVSRRDHRA